MRISLIHGEDTAKAYTKLSEVIEKAKTKNFQIITVDSPKKAVSQSLFEDKIVFLLDRPSKVKLADWKWLKTNSAKYNSNLLIYFEGSAPATITRNLPKDTKIEKFELPKMIFKFLDNFQPGNSKLLINLLQEISQIEPLELIFHLLSLRLRELYWAKVSPQTLNLPDWRKQRLNSKFTKNELEKLISNLAEIDIRSKKGENLKQMLDIFILKELK